MMRTFIARRWWLVWLCLLPALLPGLAVASTERLLVLGDSLSAHYGLSEAEGWVALLQKRLDAAGHGLELINASISGDTTGGGASRLPALLKTHQPDWVLIELGANDGLRGLPPAEIKRNLLNMVELIRAAEAEPLLVGMQLPLNYGRYYRTRFADVFTETAAATETPLLPFLLEGVGGVAALNLPDGIHPNAAGQQRVQGTVWDFLVTVFQW